VSALRRLAVACAALALLAAFRSDRPAATGRVGAPRATARSAPPGTAALPRFALFGWVSPPREFATSERYAELAEAGFDVTVLAWEDSGTVADNRARLDFTRPLGVRNLILDMRLDRLVHDMPSTFGIVDTVAATYRDEPALLGYYLGDEPTEERFEWLGRAFALFRERDPSHPAWNNLRGPQAFGTIDEWQRYVRAYAAATEPAVLCVDQYDFLTDRDAGQIVSAAAGSGAIARERGVPFWGIVLLTEHVGFRHVTPGMLRWQVAQWLSYGARGVGYFTYWTPAPHGYFQWRPGMIDWDTAQRTAHYATVRALNRLLRPVGETLAGATWIATEHAGSVPPGGTAFAPDELLRDVQGRAVLGWFADSLGAPLLLVANQDSAAAQAVTLTFGGTRTVMSIDSTYTWQPRPVFTGSGVTRATCELEPGDFVLLRPSGDLDALASGRRGPWLLAQPQPARDAVRFTAQRLAGAARLELLDLSGRRVWGADLHGSNASLEWRGDREAGGRAAPGVYLARLEDARGVSVRRVHWLGGR